MWPLGHAAVAYLLLSLGAEREWLPDPDLSLVAAVLLASQAPDLLDKPFAWYVPVLPAGRSLGHSLFVLLPICVAAIVLARRIDRPGIGLAVAIGLLSHVTLDAIPALWGGEGWRFLLWPVLSVEGFPSPPSILAMLENTLDDPWFQLEFLLAGLALLRWRADGFPGIAWLLPSTDRGVWPARSEERGD